MKVSVDISLYPLKSAYREPIKEFIGRLSAYTNLEISYGSMSTVVYGDYAEIMSMLEKEIETTLETLPKSIFIIKLSGGCREQ
ncbi:hypothetical protein [Thiomicrorhabdus xiamenensis]|uniref:YKOF-related Family n=1 Tax=Thiomicrorhabdus xiamenensis TaxID=2739063 RepID=A0A7D4NK12_9GAMM|nr:hypothetical protein [Thiomicrorhabdus xiamenensis]QKI88809.1 hypothetical protein HQN79_04120 [Thiomicrorhabdus xiamenensis]